MIKSSGLVLSPRWLPLMAFVLSVFFSGCATEQLYEGKKLPEKDIAHVSTPVIFIPIYDSQIYIRFIDNEYIGLFVNKVELLPGKYSFTTVLQGPFPVHLYGVIDLDVEAGHFYQIDMSDEGFIWAVDQATGEVVAGVKPN